MQPHHVVILGGGFGGLEAARALKKAPVRVTLVDRRNFHLFQPLLYQVATGGLSPANIATPLRTILRKQPNVEVLLAEAVEFDVAQRRVVLRDGEIFYDSLIVAAGSRPSYFGHDQWETVAPGLKTIEDATEIRRRILLAFEEAERVDDPQQRAALMQFVIVGGGPTGVELAGTIAEIATYTLRNEFRRIDPSEAQFLLVDAGDHLLSSYPLDLSAKATQALERLGVQVRTQTQVVDIQPDRVELESAAGSETVRTRTVIWAAGVQASPLSRTLGAAAGATVDRAGRISVEPDCSLAGHPEIFVIGDMAHLLQSDAGHPLPGVAPVAIQQGRHAARTIVRRLQILPSEPFRYRDRGSMATVGRRAAIAQIGKWKFAGAFAWLLWLFVHLMSLVQFQNRVLVLFQWAWNYFTFSRTARLITGEVLPIARTDHAFEPPREEGAAISIGENPEHVKPPAS